MKRKELSEDDAKLEANIEKSLKDGAKSHRELRAELKTSEDDPALSRTLQRLRRQKRIQIVGGRWVLANFTLCPTCKGKGWVKA